MAIFAAVNLYRYLKSPQYQGGTFEGEGSYSDLIPLIELVIQSKFGRFEEVMVDGREFQCDEIPSEGKEIFFKFICVSSKPNNFYQNIDALIDSCPDIHRGVLPDEFYLVDDNYFSLDFSENNAVEKLKSLCEFISNLSSLALYHDKKNNFKLIFSSSDAATNKTIEIETKISKSILNTIDVLDCRLLNELSKNSKLDPHYSEKIGVFGVTLAEFVNKNSSSEVVFDYLVTNWSGFLTSFHNNLSVYLSGFAFHKAKREVAAAELSMASDLSRVVGDIATKLFGIPISLAAVAAVTKSNEMADIFIGIFGLFIFGILMTSVVNNQKRYLHRILHAKDLVLGALEGKKSEYPKELSSQIDRMKDNLENDERNIKSKLRLFVFVSWIPFALSVGILGFKFREEVFIWLEDYVSLLSQKLVMLFNLLVHWLKLF